jgi:hypothetical protein
MALLLFGTPRIFRAEHDNLYTGGTGPIKRIGWIYSKTKAPPTCTAHQTKPRTAGFPMTARMLD